MQSDTESGPLTNGNHLFLMATAAPPPNDAIKLKSSSEPNIYKFVDSLIRNTSFTKFHELDERIRPLHFLNKNSVHDSLFWSDQLEKNAAHSNAGEFGIEVIDDNKKKIISKGCHSLGCVSQWGGDSSIKVPVICFEKHPGVVYLPTFLSLRDQVYLANETLRKYTNPPNQSNLTRLLPLKEQANLKILPRSSLWPPSSQQQQHDNNSFPSSDTPFILDQSKNALESLSNRNRSSLNELRWVTIGYQYNWTSRLYDSFTPFPTALSTLAATAVKAVVQTVKRFDTQQNNNNGDLENVISAILYEWKDVSLSESSSFEPNCAIINFYRGSDRLRGHTDEVEGSTGLPLVSINLGKSAIFMIGGTRKSDASISSLVLQSGDVLIMGGPSRLSYHGVPKLLHYGTTSASQEETSHEHSLLLATKSVLLCKNPNRSELEKLFFVDDVEQSKSLHDDASFSAIDRHTEFENNLDELIELLMTTRINLSIRQVITPGNTNNNKNDK